MKTSLIDVLSCDRCRGVLVDQGQVLVCRSCGQSIPLEGGIPLFTAPPTGLHPSAKLARGPHVGTPWRQANWRFLSEQVKGLDSQAVILDVGAGRGDFAELFVGHSNYLALDIYPYPETDIVCDLTQTNPFQGASLDAVLLMNVLEHVYDAHALLASLAEMLKPSGALIAAIPFLVKMHQVPVDFARYTHYALQRFAPDHGLEISHLEGFYDPVSLLGEGIGNLKNAVLPEVRGARHYTGRALAWTLQASASGLRALLGPGQDTSPKDSRSQAPTGYHLVYRKIK
jgi:SAM-dependent methyltransferase